MRKKALVFVFCVIAWPAFGQSSWPADKVKFSDTTNLESKVADGSVGVNAPHLSTSETATQTVASEIQKGTDVFWNAGNDGAGSGLDADTLDGSQASAFYQGATPLAASAYAGPLEMWLGRPKLISDGASQSPPAVNYLQSEEIAHTGDTSSGSITFNNSQDRYNMVLEGATGGSFFLITFGAYSTVTTQCGFGLYKNDVTLLGEHIGTSAGAAIPRESAASIQLAEGVTQDIQLWVPSFNCTLTTSSAWNSFWKIERY